jgi:putative flippase GtrA
MQHGFSRTGLSVIRIRNKRLIAKFLIVGTVAFFANYLILEFVLANFTDSKLIASIIAMVFTINLTFLLHDRWTYVKNSAEYHLSILKRYPSYLLSNSSGSLITIAIFTVLSRTLPNIISLGVAALTAMTWNFVINLIVWRHDGKVASSVEILSENEEEIST